MAQLRDILRTIQEEYRYPVDTEFTVNLSENGDYVVNILQCRPLQVFQDSEETKMPEDVDPAAVVFECRYSVMGLSRSVRLDAVVYVDPVKYYRMPYRDKYRVAQAVSAVNQSFRGQGKKLLLMAPGRIGTSSPELGVPTSFFDISEFSAICEIADSQAGYNPELSYGSHFFQDLVESGILYNAIFENEKTLAYHPERLESCRDDFAGLVKDGAGLEEIVRVWDVSASGLRLCSDLKTERILCYFET